MNTEKPLQDAVRHHIDEKDALDRKAQAANAAATVLAEECGTLRKRVAELEHPKHAAYVKALEAERIAAQERIAEMEAQASADCELIKRTARANGGLQDDLAAERAAHLETRRALEDAATSLRAIADNAGKDDYLRDVCQIRGFANSRAAAARAAVAKEGGAL